MMTAFVIAYKFYVYFWRPIHTKMSVKFVELIKLTLPSDKLLLW